MITVYILKSLKDGGYYIGITKNIGERLRKHNSGKVISTKYRKPFVVIFTENFEDYKSAREKEIKIKSYKGGNEFKKLINQHCRVV